MRFFAPVVGDKIAGRAAADDLPALEIEETVDIELILGNAHLLVNDLGDLLHGLALELVHLLFLLPFFGQIDQDSGNQLFARNGKDHLPDVERNVRVFPLDTAIHDAVTPCFDKTINVAKDIHSLAPADLTS